MRAVKCAIQAATAQLRMYGLMCGTVHGDQEAALWMAWSCYFQSNGLVIACSRSWLVATVLRASLIECLRLQPSQCDVTAVTV